MMIYQAIGLMLTLVYILVFLSYLYGWLKAKVFRPFSFSQPASVTVVVAARNEEKNIGRLLGDLVAQQLPGNKFRVIVVDDFSNDRTYAVAAAFASETVQVLRLHDSSEKKEEQAGSKKQALQWAIARSSSELIVTTDADCRMGPYWLYNMVRFYEVTKADMVVAPVLTVESHNLLQRLLNLESAGWAGITAAALELKIPMLCNGANLAFSRKAFEAVGGYTSFQNVSSGDDVLLMQRLVVCGFRNIRFLMNDAVVVTTAAPATWSTFFAQRFRWASKAAHFRNPLIRLNLVFIFLFCISIFITACLAFIEGAFLWLLLIQVLSKTVMDLVFLFSVTRVFGYPRWLWLLLPAEVFQVVYITITGLMAPLIKVQWKGRKVR